MACFHGAAWTVGVSDTATCEGVDLDGELDGKLRETSLGPRRAPHPPVRSAVGGRVNLRP